MICIASAGPHDANVVWGFLQSFATSHAPSRITFDRDYPLLIQRDGTHLLLARREGIAVGYLLAHQTLTLFAGGQILEILELYVEANYRGEGIGKALVEEAIHRAMATGCLEAVVSTRRAQGFYEALGFHPSATYLKRQVSAATDHS